MPSQVENGNSFEYAVCSKIESEINNFLIGQRRVNSTFQIIEDERFRLVKECFEHQDRDSQIQMIRAAVAGIKKVAPLEPFLWHGTSTNPIKIQVQQNYGGIGDVRDIRLWKDREGTRLLREIGLSCKWNHNAVKNSRLSHVLDFGQEWVGYPCSADYWLEISPIMERIAHRLGSNWNEYEEKLTDVYIPMLQAFTNEVLVLNERADNFPAKLTEYLIGRSDYYKIMGYSGNKITYTQAYNLHRQLNKQYSRAHPYASINTDSGGAPTRIAGIFPVPEKPDTITIIMDEGWQFTFRIHSARTEIEKSLKFDIRFTGNPIAFFSEFWS